MQEPSLVKETVKPTVKPKSNRKIWIIIIAVVLVICVLIIAFTVVAGFLILKSNYPMPTEIPGVTSGPGATLKVSPTVGISSSIYRLTNILEFEGGDELNSRIYITDDWILFDPISSDPTTFSINYPSDWSADGMQLYDENDEQIAQVTGVIKLKTGQTCLDNFPTVDFQSDTGFDYRIISRQNVTIGGKSAVKLSVGVSEGDSAVYYGVSYCLNMGDGTAFFASFAEESPGIGNRQLFEAMMATVRVVPAALY